MLCKSRDERRFPFVFQLKVLSKAPAGIDAWTMQYVAIAIVPDCVGLPPICVTKPSWTVRRLPGLSRNSGLPTNRE